MGIVVVVNCSDDWENNMVAFTVDLHCQSAIASLSGLTESGFSAKFRFPQKRRPSFKPRFLMPRKEGGLEGLNSRDSDE
jgi:hypothetical protein